MRSCRQGCCIPSKISVLMHIVQLGNYTGRSRTAVSCRCKLLLTRASVRLPGIAKTRKSSSEVQLLDFSVAPAQQESIGCPPIVEENVKIPVARGAGMKASRTSGPSLAQPDLLKECIAQLNFRKPPKSCTFWRGPFDWSVRRLL